MVWTLWKEYSQFNGSVVSEIYKLINKFYFLILISTPPIVAADRVPHVVVVVGLAYFDDLWGYAGRVTHTWHVQRDNQTARDLKFTRIARKGEVRFLSASAASDVNVGANQWRCTKQNEVACEWVIYFRKSVDRTDASLRWRQHGVLIPLVKGRKGLGHHSCIILE